MKTINSSTEGMAGVFAGRLFIVLPNQTRRCRPHQWLLIGGEQFYSWHSMSDEREAELRNQIVKVTWTRLSPCGWRFVKKIEVLP
jgi:hypothetical protein